MKVKLFDQNTLSAWGRKIVKMELALILVALSTIYILGSNNAMSTTIQLDKWGLLMIGNFWGIENYLVICFSLFVGFTAFWVLLIISGSDKVFMWIMLIINIAPLVFLNLPVILMTGTASGWLAMITVNTWIFAIQSFLAVIYFIAVLVGE